MSDVKNIIKSIAGVFASPVVRALILAGILAAFTITDFLLLNLARRTFVFYTVIEGIIVVENRMIKNAETREIDIKRYAEETLLGPASPGLLQLFPKGTKLISLIYRDGVVYINMSKDAQMPPIEGGTTFNNFRTFYQGILRNFTYVSDVRFFIEGSVIYADGFM
ncbi:MAG: GerMN domain-containing protein [Treponema sp.]|nr:GerMN domain-containing protein [Treponema sp.]